MTIPAGQTAETSLCLVPTGKLPAVEQRLTLLRGWRIRHSRLSIRCRCSFLVPLFGTVEGQLAPASKAMLAGQTTTTDFAITSVGNQAQGQIDVTATVPAGSTLTGLTTPVNLTPGQTAVQVLTIGQQRTLPRNAAGDSDQAIVGTGECAEVGYANVRRGDIERGDAVRADRRIEGEPVRADESG